MEILAAKDSPQQCSVRQEKALPLISARRRHANRVRVIAGQPVPEGDGADFPGFLLEAGLYSRAHEFLINLDGNGKAHARFWVLSFHGLLAFERC
jgi:hypothetical protein